METNLTTKSGTLKTIAHNIGNQILRDKLSNDLEASQRQLADIFTSFDQDDLRVTFEEFDNCHRLLIEITCLLSDPSISKKIQEKYYQKNAGRILKNMLKFFESLADNSEIHYYITYLNLINFSSSFTIEQLEEIKRYYNFT